MVGRTSYYQKVVVDDARGALGLIVDSPSCTDYDGGAFVVTTRLIAMAVEQRDGRIGELVCLLGMLSPLTHHPDPKERL